MIVAGKEGRKQMGLLEVWPARCTIGPAKSKTNKQSQKERKEIKRNKIKRIKMNKLKR
jgi:hypothetical protein